MFQKFMENRMHKPRTNQVYWCNQCDHNQVDSDKPETGSFFLIFGHTFDKRNRIKVKQNYKLFQYPIYRVFEYTRQHHEVNCVGD